MNKIIKKFLSIFLTINIITATIPVAIFATNNTVPSYTVSNPNVASVNVGGTVIYSVYYNNATNINLNVSHVILNGFSANINIRTSGDARVITLSNIQGTAGNKSIGISEGSASSSAGYCGGVSNSNSFYLNVPYVDRENPSLSVSKPSTSSVYVGGAVSYTVSFNDNIKVTSVNLSAAYIILNGFTANVSVNGSGNTRTVTLSNIQGSVGNKNISIKTNAAVDSAGNGTYATPNSASFAIVEKPKANVNTNTGAGNNNKNNNSTKTNTKTNANKTQSPVSEEKVDITSTSIKEVVEFERSNPVIKSGCEDNEELLGDINKGLKEFGAWVKSEKSAIKYVQQKNYITAGDEVTYFVEYYNGSNETLSNASLSLVIPKGTDVLEISGDGAISDQTKTKTVIGWKLSNVVSGERCRVYVKVKYITDENLVESKNISEIFFVNLKTSANGKTNNSYLRQLLIDNNESKIGTVKKYLTSLDNSENIRPNDEITRAELAVMIEKSGLVEGVTTKDEYKKYKDSKDIQSNARNAVSIMRKLDIMEADAYGRFNPNNPILRDDMLKVISKVLEYSSEDKLKATSAVGIYSSILKDENNKVSVQKDYIMDLVRQNIIAKEDVRAGEYALKREAVELINIASFRGPYLEETAKNAMKFNDIDDSDKYLYSLLGASNSYKYTYTKELLQKITEVQK